MMVLDSSAILAHVLDEPGGPAVRAQFDRAAVSSVNMAEVITRLMRSGVAGEDATRHIAAYDLNIHPATQSQAQVAGTLSVHRQLSLGDRFCIALARELRLPVLTADRVWASLGLDVPVELIR